MVILTFSFADCQVANQTSLLLSPHCQDPGRRCKERAALVSTFPLTPLAAPPPHWRPETCGEPKHTGPSGGKCNKTAAKSVESWHCRPGQGAHYTTYLPAGAWPLSSLLGKVRPVCQCLHSKEHACSRGLPREPCSHPQLLRIKRPVGSPGLLWGGLTWKACTRQTAGAANSRNRMAFRARLTSSSLPPGSAP